jgi:DNA-directed RNA polymerase subunit RPC12/RpoP
MTEPLECMRCKARMEPGYVADLAHGGYVQENWSSGTPKPSFWFGLKVDTEHSIPITTLRCPSCGYLESYASHPAQ